VIRFRHPSRQIFLYNLTVSTCLYELLYDMFSKHVPLRLSVRWHLVLHSVRCGVHKTENVKSQSFPGLLGTAVQDLGYGHSLLLIIVINIKGCALRPAEPTLRRS
jgi:hypothetical protein